MLHKTHDMWHMEHDRMGGGWTCSQSSSYLALIALEWKCFEYIFTKDDLIKLINLINYLDIVD